MPKKLLTEREIRNLVRMALKTEGVMPGMLPGGGGAASSSGGGPATAPAGGLPSGTQLSATAGPGAVPDVKDYFYHVPAGSSYVLSFYTDSSENAGKTTRSTSDTKHELFIKSVIAPEGKSGKKFGVIYDDDFKAFMNFLTLDKNIPTSGYPQAWHAGVENIATALSTLSKFGDADPQGWAQSSLGGMKGTGYNFSGKGSSQSSNLDSQIAGIKSGLGIDDIVVAGYGAIDKALLKVPIPAVQMTNFSINLNPFARGSTTIPVPWFSGGTIDMTKYTGGGQSGASTGYDESPWGLQGFSNPGYILAQSLKSELNSRMAANPFKKAYSQEGYQANQGWGFGSYRVGASAVIKHDPLEGADWLKAALNGALNSNSAVSLASFYKVLAVYSFLYFGGAELIAGIKSEISAIGDVTGTVNQGVSGLIDSLSGD